MKKLLKKFKSSYRKVLIIYWWGICFELLMSFYYNIYKPNMFMALFHGGFLAYFISMLIKTRRKERPFLKAVNNLYDALPDNVKKELNENEDK